MARGAPDYSNVRAASPLHRLDDMAELAARQGCPSIYDRPGNVVWMQSFESGLQGSTFGTSGAGSSGSLVSSRSIHGAFCIELDPGNVSGNYAEWRSLVHYFPVGKTGYEVSLSLDTNSEEVWLYILAYDGENVLKARIVYYPANGNWDVRKDDGSLATVLTGVKLQQGPTGWHPFKLVIDTEDEVYVRFQIDKHVVDLSDYAIGKSANTALAQLEVGATVYGDADTHAACFFDRFIVTQNEP